MLSQVLKAIGITEIIGILGILLLVISAISFVRLSANSLKGILILAAAGALLIVVSCVILYAPRGYASLFPQNAAGAHEGDEGTEEQGDDGSGGSAMMPDESQGVFVITVEGENVYVGGRRFESMEQLSIYLEKSAIVKEIRLKDNYATLAAFRQVEDILKENGYPYMISDGLEGVKE